MTAAACQLCGDPLSHAHSFAKGCARKPPPLVSSSATLAEVLREEASAYRHHARDLLAAELAADWSKVAAARGALVDVAHGLEALAERYARDGAAR